MKSPQWIPPRSVKEELLQKFIDNSFVYEKVVSVFFARISVPNVIYSKK